MVTLEPRQTTQEANQALEDKVNLQVAEIMEAAEVEVERDRELKTRTPAWQFSMPFAGVRYFSYD